MMDFDVVATNELLFAMYVFQEAVSQFTMNYHS
jgi:hypothetical protein